MGHTCSARRQRSASRTPKTRRVVRPIPALSWGPCVSSLAGRFGLLSGTFGSPCSRSAKPRRDEFWRGTPVGHTCSARRQRSASRTPKTRRVVRPIPALSWGPCVSSLAGRFGLLSGTFGSPCSRSASSPMALPWPGTCCCDSTWQPVAPERGRRLLLLPDRQEPGRGRVLDLRRRHHAHQRLSPALAAAHHADLLDLRSAERAVRHQGVRDPADRRRLRPARGGRAAGTAAVDAAAVRPGRALPTAGHAARVGSRGGGSAAGTAAAHPRARRPEPGPVDLAAGGRRLQPALGAPGAGRGLRGSHGGPVLHRVVTTRSDGGRWVPGRARSRGAFAACPAAPRRRRRPARVLRLQRTCLRGPGARERRDEAVVGPHAVGARGRNRRRPEPASRRADVAIRRRAARRAGGLRLPRAGLVAGAPFRKSGRPDGPGLLRRTGRSDSGTRGHVRLDRAHGAPHLRGLSLVLRAGVPA